MNIIILPEYNRTGGALSFLVKILQINKRKGNRVTILLEKEKRYDIIEALISQYHLSIIEIPKRPKFFYKPYFSVLFEIWIWLFYIPKTKYDIFLISNINPWINIGYFIFVKHMIYFMHTYPQSKLSWKASAMYLLTKFVNEKKCVATVSQFSAKQISKKMAISNKYIHVIYNSYNSNCKNIIRNETTPIVLTIGHVIDYKNPLIWFKVAMKVIEKKPDIKFYWVGDGIMLESMKKKVYEYNLTEKIIFFGHSDDVNSFYSKAIVYFQPSRVESQGIALVEAMCAGIPCVISNIGGMPESVSDNINGYICEVDDVEEFSRKILKLISNSNLATHFGKMGRKIALEKYSESIQELKIYELFKFILNKN